MATGLPFHGPPLVRLSQSSAFFNAPDKQAAKMIHAAQTDSIGGRAGVYITNGKEKPLPKLAVDQDVQARLKAKLTADAGL